jgi:hypothetical protein
LRLRLPVRLRLRLATGWHWRQIHHLAQVCKSLELCKEHGGGLWIVNSVGDHVQLQTRALRLKAAGKLQSRGEVGG